MSISAKELADLRAIADDFLPDTCTIQTKGTTAGAMGGITEAFTNTYTGVACRLDPMGAGSEAVTNFVMEGESGWMLNIPYNQAIAIEYRVVHSGKTYEVARVMDTNSYATIRRAVLKRVD